MRKLPIIVTMSLLLGLGQSSTDIFLSSLPDMSAAFRVSPAICNFLVSAFALGLAFGCLTCGFFSDRFGRRRSLLLAAAGYFLCSLGIAFSPWLWLAVAFRFLQAYCAAFPIIVSRQFLTDVCDKEEQVKYTALMLMGITLSPALAPLVGTWIAHFSSWRMDFVFSAAAAVPLWLALFVLLPETLKEPQPLPRPETFFQEYAVCFKSRVFVGFSFTIALVYGAFFGFISMCSYIYMVKLGYSAHAFSTVYACLALAYFVGNGGLQLMRKAKFDAFALCSVGLGVGLFGSFLNFGSFFEMGCRFAMGIFLAFGVALMRGGYAVMVPPMQVEALNTGSGRPGTAVGLIFFLQYVSGAVVSSIAASFHQYPLHGTVVILAILMLLSIPAYLWGRSGMAKPLPAAS